MADSLWDRLKAVPLLAELTDESNELLEFECQLALGERSEVKDADETNLRPSYLRIAHFPEGEVIHHQGDLCAQFCIVLSGSAQMTRTHPREGTQLVETIQANGWFGETTALSEMPSLTTNRAASACELAFLDARLFQKVYIGEEDEPFEEKINETYRDRELSLHLRNSPLFADADPELLKQLKSECEFERHEHGDEIADEGDDVDAFYLVRSGGIECSRIRDDGTKQVLSYYMANSSFGEQAVCTKDATWPGACVARTAQDPQTPSRVYVVKIPVAAFRRAREANPKALRSLTHVANLLVTGDDDELSRTHDDPMARREAEVMVDGQAYKGGESLVIDQMKCIRCNMCVESCASVHRDGIPRISKIGNAVETNDVLVTACYHCAIPSCMAACAYGAIRRDERGVVRFVMESCVGCCKCPDACPYDVIKMTDLAHHQQALEKKPPGLVGSLLGLLLGRTPGGVGVAGCGEGVSLTKYVINMGEDADDRQAAVNGKSLKCDLCAGLPFEACVYNCPTSAIHRRTPESLFVKN